MTMNKDDFSRKGLVRLFMAKDLALRSLGFALLFKFHEKMLPDQALIRLATTYLNKLHQLVEEQEDESYRKEYEDVDSQLDELVRFSNIHCVNS